MNQSLLNSLCYTAGWFLCVLGGIQGHFLLVLAGALFLIVIQLINTKKQNLCLYVQDLLLAIVSIFLGWSLETFFVQTNIIHYAHQTNKFPPIWIVLLYPLFAVTINHSLKILKNGYSLPFLFGFFGAPFSYIAGRALGALTFQYSLTVTWIAIGTSWGIFLCLLIKVALVIGKAASETLEDYRSERPLKLLYDGDCPICNREVCFLQKKQENENIEFVDIASINYSAAEHRNIDYNTAMTQMHAIDGQGNVLTGVPVFAAVYARSGLFLTSTLLRIPILRLILNPIYRIFAKNRLRLTGRNNPKL